MFRSRRFWHLFSLTMLMTGLMEMLKIDDPVGAFPVHGRARALRHHLPGRHRLQKRTREKVIR
jgi:hypothetical protein